MTSRPLNSLKQFLVLIALLLATLQAVAIDLTQSADDYFHNGAMFYLSNNIPGALNVVTNGLAQYPENEKLKKLEALLKQQQQQNQDQQNQQQDQNEQSDQQQQSKPQDQKDKDQQSEQDQQQQQSKQQEQPQKEQESQQDAGKSGEPDKQDTQGQPANASNQQQEMTPEQALRVLDSTKGDEKVLPLQPQQPPPQSPEKFKDW
jgi:Ca-activated chloride channel family protein